MMKRLITLAAIFLMTVSAVVAAETSAAEVLRQATTALKQSQSIEAAFTITQGKTTSSGRIIMSGNNFNLSTPDMVVWFNGKTQWAYSPTAGEVNISEPTVDELEQINPFVIITAMQKSFTSRRVKASVANTNSIELTPKTKSDYKRIVATFSCSTHLPVSFVITTTDNAVTTVKVTSIKQGARYPASQFSFNAKLYPGVDIVDLR
jgi:outer membrane lipoprotein-sorting protein